MIDTNSIRFKKFMEGLNLYFPLAFFLLCLFESFFFNKALWQHKDTLGFIQNVLFVNSIHVIFSYYLLFTTASGKQWLKQAPEQFKYFYFRFILVFLFFGFAWYFYSTNSLAEYAPYLFFYLMLVPRYHEITQAKGILYLLLMNDPKAQLAQKKFKTLNILFNIYFVFTLLLSARIFLPNKLFLPFETLYLTLGSIFITVATIHIIVLKNTKASEVRYSIFHVRFYLDLLIPYSALASFAAGSIHGVEYTVVASQLTEKNGMKKSYLYPLLVIIVLVWVGFRYPFYLFRENFNLDNNLVLGSIMLGLVASFTFGHYFLDNFMFSARYPRSKELFLKRLFKPLS